MDIWRACNCLHSQLMADESKSISRIPLFRRETRDEDFLFTRWLLESRLWTLPEPQGRNETARRGVRHAACKARRVSPRSLPPCEILFHAPLCPEHTVCMGSRPQCSLAVCSRSSSADSGYLPGTKLSGVHSGFWSLQRRSHGADATAIWKTARGLNRYLISSKPLLHVKRFGNPNFSE